MNKDKINTSAIKNSITQKSQAIYRRTVQKPVSQMRPMLNKLGKNIGQNMDFVRKNKNVSKFSSVNDTKKTNAAKTAPAKPERISPARPHPITKNFRALKTIAHAQPVALPSLQETKKQAIKEAYEKVDEIKAIDKKEKSKKQKKLLIVGVGLLLIAACFVLTLINLPHITMSIANARSGMNASIPGFKPDGYGIDGAVKYSDGKVVIDYKSNNNDGKAFSITQEKSTWDSTAVKEKAESEATGLVATTNEGGLTIFIYDNNAAWVNGGILYTIKSSEPFGNNLIRRIAASL